MYRKILVPLDGSKRAETILSHVEELAHTFESKVLLIRVVEPEIFYAGGHGMVRDFRIEEELLEEEVEKADTYLSGIAGVFREKGFEVESIVESGSVVQRIIDVAEREKVDLIAMASHGRSGLSHVFYGSVAAGVLHRVDRPLLLVRAE